MEYYTAIGKNEKLMHEKTQVKLRNITLSERSMTQNMYCVILFCKVLGNENNVC